MWRQLRNLCARLARGGPGCCRAWMRLTEGDYLDRACRQAAQGGEAARQALAECHDFLRRPSTLLTIEKVLSGSEDPPTRAAASQAAVARQIALALTGQLLRLCATGLGDPADLLLWASRACGGPEVDL